ncbi:MAG: WG repeat-containing protein [Fluviicola sp.]|nr:WG repeat-containing protein [Fluviicola sp.]
MQKQSALFSKKLLFFFFLFFSFLSFGQEMVTFHENGKYGYKRNQQIVIPASFDYAVDFWNGHALVKQGNNWGYIRPNGSWLFEPQFANGESFRSGVAIVINEKGQQGLIDTTGKIVVPLAYTKIVRDYNEFNLFSGTKTGLYQLGWDLFIDAKYDNIRVNLAFVFGKNGSDYTIYHKGNELATTNVMPKLINFNHDFIDILKGGKVGLMDTLGRLVVPAEYESFDMLSTNEFHIQPNDEGYYYLYVFSKWDMEFNADIGEDLPVNKRFDVYLPNGKRLTNESFSALEHKGDVVEMVQNGKIGFFKNNGTIRFTDYNQFVEYGNYLLGFKLDETVDILSKEDTTVLRSFVRAEIPTITNYSVDENTGDLIEYQVPAIRNELIVYDRKTFDNEASQSAIFDLNSMCFITTFDTNKKEVTQVFGDGIYSPVIVQIDEDHSNFWLVGTKPISTYPYSRIFDHGKQFIELVSPTEDVLYSMKTGKKFPISNNETVMQSILKSSETYYQDPETDEGYWQPVYHFSVPFVLIEQENGKLNVLDYEERMYSGGYDSLIQQSDGFSENYPILTTYKNGKYGAINLRNGVEIQPQFNHAFHLSYFDDLLDFACFRYNEDDPHYISPHGKKFYSDSFDFMPFKSGNKKGFKAYSNFEDDKLNIQVPALYKQLDFTEFSGVLKATNMKKKCGLINVVGDTLLNLEYDDVSYIEIGMGSDYNGFQLKKGKKIGLFNPVNYKLIPAEYDAIIEKSNDYGGNDCFIVVSDEKYGVYTKDLDLVLPCEYDFIKYQMRNGVPEFTLLKNGKISIIHLYNLDDLILLDEYIENSPWYDLVFNQHCYIREGNVFKGIDYRSQKQLPDLQVNQVIPYEQWEGQVVLQDGMLGFKNASGKWILEPYTNWVEFIDLDWIQEWQNGTLTQFSLDYVKGKRLGKRYVYTEE